MDREKKKKKRREKWKEVWVRQKGYVVCELTQGESSRAYLDTERSVYFGGEGNVEDSPQGLCSLSHEARASQCCFWTNQATALCPFQHALSCLGLNGKHSGTLSPPLCHCLPLFACVRKTSFQKGVPARWCTWFFFFFLQMCSRLKLTYYPQTMSQAHRAEIWDAGVCSGGPNSHDAPWQTSTSPFVFCFLFFCGCSCLSPNAAHIVH